MGFMKKMFNIALKAWPSIMVNERMPDISYSGDDGKSRN
jgi:hypothetical protein